MTAPRTPLRRRLRIAGIAALCIAALPATLGAKMGVEQLTGNFHTVIPGELYRSGQPSGDDVALYAKQYGIKTILNLRNEKRTEWYADEVAAAKQAGITLIDLPLSSKKVLSNEDGARLAALMRDAPKPLLIHCEHGANRTGLASAIYLGAVAGRSELEAELQISPLYGHVPIRGIGRYQMYQSWDAFEETIGF